MAYGYDQLQNTLLTGIGGTAFFESPRKIKRDQLNEKHESNDRQIEKLLEENKKIEEALELLDMHPIIEKLDNLLVKLGVR